MKVRFSLSVKFRAVGITFGSLSWDATVDAPKEASTFVDALVEKVKFDSRGVKLSVAVVA